MPPAADERGAGLIGTIAALSVFLVLLTFAVQLLFNLYATSAVTAAAYDAATMVASGSVDADDPADLGTAVRSAEEHARSLLGDYGDRATFDWDLRDDRVRLSVEVDHARVAISPVLGAFGLNRVERSVEVRVERPR
ncbi:hypothetical protein [Actinomarinicola tropica]|uniref:Uncharacterized protein n=1 Tax=Actinomarinicola tropica TaxID=2789776 RepID=A0A5Q2RJH2_9ACTN|nr:hypothetical protein [Actinomarinicola tropica]QGG95654.1 hypothetical protein GH723_11415 [Actinomarinicola tropica]